MIEAMIDAYLERDHHNRNHNGTNVDLINCAHCQDEYMAWDTARHIVWSANEPEPIVWSNDVEPFVPVDRLEDVWV